MWLTQSETPGGDERELALEHGGMAVTKGRGEQTPWNRREGVEDGYACRWVKR